VRRTALLAAAAALYTVAAMAVRPGFFDGFSAQEPYRFVNPPPCCTHGNLQPQAGHLTVKVGTNGQTDPGTAFTAENSPQASLSFLPGAFDDPERVPVTVDITPESTYPDLGSLQCATNVYLFKASKPLKLEALITLRYSDQVGAPSEIWYAPPTNGTWTKPGSTGAASPFYISARSQQLGYFAACYPPGATTHASGPTIGGGQTLPIIVALAVVLVVLGGIPLAVMRRRGGGEPEPERTGERSPEATRRRAPSRRRGKRR
jgi:hypothetical protein